MNVKEITEKIANSSQRTNVVVRNILGAFFVKGCSIAITLILVPVTIGYVSSELYGVWLALSTIIMWASLFDLGFGHGARNKIAESLAVGDTEKARKYISTAYIFFIAVFVPLSVLFYYLCPLVNWSNLLNVNQAYEEELVKVMQIVIVFFALTSIAKLQGTILLALQKTAISNMLDMLGLLLSLIVILILKFTTEGSLTLLAYAMCISPFAVYSLSVVWLYGIKRRDLCPGIRFFDASFVRDVLGLGLKFFFISSSLIVLFHTMNIIIANVSGPEAVTEYNVIYKYISIPLLVSSIITAPYWSAYTDAYALNDFNWMKASFIRLRKISYILIASILGLLLIYPIVFKIWLGDLVTIHLSMMIVVAVYVAIMIYNQINANIINGIGKLKIHLLLCIISTFGYIPLALLLGRCFGTMGVVAVAGLFTFLPAVILRIQLKKLINGTAKGIWCQ